MDLNETCSIVNRESGLSQRRVWGEAKYDKNTLYKIFKELIF